MPQRHRPLPRALATVVALFAALLVVGLGAPAAPAAPTEPSLTVAQLEALLAASSGGTASGYFKTVVKGTDIVRIPVTVSAVVPNYIYGMSMILFQAHGSTIEEIGGIAAGMSGSPLFVSDHGTDKLAGAVSYGDSFTRGGLGLATPVQYMGEMEDTFLPAGGAAVLPRAVQAGGRTVTRVVVARSAREARAQQAPAGTAVMAPLAVLSVSGLPVHSAAYKDVAARLARHGIEVSPFTGDLVGATAGSGAPLAGGSAMAAMLARGDVMYGALGTVTWVDGSRLVVFGHPFLDMGSIEAFVTTAEVKGIWGSNYTPYKIGAPGDVVGTLLQDRGAGVAGAIGALPAEVPVTGEVTLQPQGTIARQTSYLTDWVVNDFPNGDGVYLAADVLASAGYKATGSASQPGGATTKTTIVLIDAAGTRYTVVREDTWDDVYDVLAYLPSDPATMLSALVADPDGVAPARILSVDLAATVSPQRIAARITAVRFPRGLRAGRDNAVEVELTAFGQSTPLVVSGTLSLPAGVSATGSVNVYSAVAGQGGGESEPDAGTGSTGSKSVAERVKAVQELPTNDQLVVEFTPDGGAKGDDASASSGSDGASAELPHVTLTAEGRYVTGSLQLRTGQLKLHVDPATARYRGRYTVSGQIVETAGTTQVDLYARSRGASVRVKLATVTAEDDGEGGATFSYSGGGLTSDTTIIAEWAGDERALGTSADVSLRVAQEVRLTADRASVPAGGAVRLTARVLPGQAGQAVRFERRTGGAWVLIRTVKAVASGSGAQATLTWAPPAGTTQVRVRVPATAVNAAGTSATLTLRAS